MPLYEYECIACRESVENSIAALSKKLNGNLVSDLVKKHDNIFFIEIVDLDKRKIVTKSGKRDKNGVDLNFYIDDRTKRVVFNIRKYRFAELIYDKEDELNLKCPGCGGKNVERVISSFAFTSDLSTNMPKPDLSNLPPELRGRSFIGDYIEEKDRPKKNR